MKEIDPLNAWLHDEVIASQKLLGVLRYCCKSTMQLTKLSLLIAKKQQQFGTTCTLERVFCLFMGQSKRHFKYTSAYDVNFITSLNIT